MKRFIIIILILGVLITATITVNPKNFTSITTNKFLGMNPNSELQLRPGEFIDSENFRTTPDYKMDKRDGYQTFEIDNSGYTEYTQFYVVNRNQYAKLSGTTQNYLYVFGYTEFGVSPLDPNQQSAKMALFRVDMSDMKIKEKLWFSFLFSQRISPNWLMYQSNGYLYFAVNSMFISYEADPIPFIHLFKTNGTEAGTSYVYSYTDMTIPTLYMQCKPDGSDRNSKKYQPINILTDYRIINYKADGTNDYNLGVTGFTISEVKVDNTITTDYTTGTNGIRFNTAPASGKKVEIKFLIADSNQSSLIYNCTNSMYFGGVNDMDLFVWGNPDHLNTVYHTYAGDVTYFADTGYRTFGDNVITDVAVQNTTQLIFAENQIHYTIVSTGEDALNPIAYGQGVMSRIKGHKLWTPRTNVQIVNNNPVFISADGTINELYIISERDERNIRYLSKRDMSSYLRSTDTITRAITSTFDFETRKEYWIFFSESSGGETVYKALIYNYDNDTWYKMSGLTECTCPMLINNKLYMFGSKYSYFEPSLCHDLVDGVIKPIEAYAETPYMALGRDYVYKSIQKMFITLSNNIDKDSYVKVRYWTTGRYQEAEFYVRAGTPPKELVKSISASRFNYIKFMFISDRIDNVCSLMNYTLKLQYGGDVK